MTKEELEKEVEEYLENKHCKNVCTYDEIEECKKGIRIKCMSFNHRKELIVNFAELREKRIAELEKENKVLAQNLEDTEICEKTLKDKIAELKHDVEIWKKANENNGYKAFKLAEENTGLKEQIEKMKCCGNCIHCYEGAYHNGYRCKDHARESVCDNWEWMTDEVRKEMLEDDI